MRSAVGTLLATAVGSWQTLHKASPNVKNACACALNMPTCVNVVYCTCVNLYCVSIGDIRN